MFAYMLSYLISDSGNAIRNDMLTVEKVGGYTSLLKKSRSLMRRFFPLASLLDADKLLKISIQIQSHETK